MVRVLLIAGGVFAWVGTSLMVGAPKPNEGLYPDMRTVVPHQLQLVNAQQHEILRFSNGIANTGEGDWRMRPLFPSGDSPTQSAVQEILDSDGNIVKEQVVGEFEFHPEHNHWHIDDVALFEVRVGSPNGPVYGEASLKTTFCLIDWYKLEGNANTAERGYWDCATSYQGISVGWVDQYHQSLEGQSLDITGAPVGLYYLVSTANPEEIFAEADTTNNTAWVAFWLSRESNGNPKIEIVETSLCEEPGMCGENAPNR